MALAFESAMTIRTIVVGLDLAEPGARALRLASDTARSTGAVLWLVHAAEGAESEDSPRALERERRTCEAAGLSTQTSSEPGEPWEAILRTAVAVQADLIAVGDAAISSGSSERSLGSTAERVVQQAPCSVLVSCGALREDYRGARIAVGIDFSPHSIEAARWARDVAKAVEGHLVLVHVAPEATTESVHSGVIARLEQLVLSEGLPSSATIHVLEGPVGSTLCDALAGLEADLLFVGCRGVERLRGMTLGSVSQHCLRHSPVPVLAVRP